MSLINCRRFSFDAILEDGLTGVYQQRCEYLNMQLACDDKIVKKCLQPNRVESFKLKTVEDVNNYLNHYLICIT